MKRFLLFFMTIFAIVSIAYSQQDSLKVGDNAPDFSLPYATKDSVADDDLKLSALIGQTHSLRALLCKNSYFSEGLRTYYCFLSL